MKVTIHNSDGTRTHYGWQPDTEETFEDNHRSPVRNMSSMCKEGNTYTVAGYINDLFFFREFTEVSAAREYHKQQRHIIRTNSILP